jgi:hypothetical protein
MAPSMDAQEGEERGEGPSHGLEQVRDMGDMGDWKGTL